MKRIALVLLAALAPLAWLVGLSQSPPPPDPAALARAAKAYEAGRYGLACQEYEKAAGDSAAYWYDYGLALQQAGDPARATAAFERARLRSPRDPDILEHATGPWWAWLTPAEAMAGWALLSFLGVALPRLRGVLLALALPFGLLLALQWADGAPRAVVVGREVRLRTGPGREFEAGAPAAAGALVRLRGESGAWRRIRLGAGPEGWVRREELETI